MRNMEEQEEQEGPSTAVPPWLLRPGTDFTDVTLVSDDLLEPGRNPPSRT